MPSLYQQHIVCWLGTGGERYNRIPSTQRAIRGLKMNLKKIPGNSGFRLPEKCKPAASAAYVSR
jgi:hypothetical protein